MSLYIIKKKLEVFNLFQKTTNAMKLIALSSRNQIKKSLANNYMLIHNLEFFINSLFNKLLDNINKINEHQILYIFIGEERGFCGNFSQHIVSQYSKIDHSSSKKIIIGKTFFKKIKQFSHPDIFISDFKASQIETILQKILDFINLNKIEKISIYYIKSKSLIESDIEEMTFYCHEKFYTLKKYFSSGGFSEESIIKILLSKYIQLELHTILMESLYSEQTARYIAMDGALKNTEENINECKKLYFKMRQKKINRELEDVVSNLI